jgi:hypothetical protein
MRYILYIVIFIFILSCDKCKEYSDSPDIDIKARVIRSYDTILSPDTLKHKAFEINISLINKSVDPVTFWIMTSSWIENFIINNDYVQFILGDYHGNYPYKPSLKSNDSLVFNTSVIISYDNTIGGAVKTTKFGFIYIDTDWHKKTDNYHEIIWDKSEYDKIYWSNALYLKDIK